MPKPFQTEMLIPAVEGLDLRRSLDQISKTGVSRMTNAVRNFIGEFSGRPGLTSFATAGGADGHHSISRITDPLTTTSRLIVGAGTVLYQGTSGALASTATGFSGDPLSLLTYRPPLSGQAWMFVGDSSKMVKVRSTDALTLALGLAPPATAATAAAAATNETLIDDCEVASWTNNQGTGGGVPANALDNVNFKEGTSSVVFTTDDAATAYYQFWGKSNIIDLSMVGALPATDDDIIHIWLRLGNPAGVVEVRLYFVLGTALNTSVLPGTSETTNQNAYFHSFRPSDYTAAVAAAASLLGGATTANTNIQTLQQAGVSVPQDALGAGAWTEFGAVGLPLRRGDFMRIGTDAFDWSDVVGLVVYVSMAADEDTQIWIDDIYLVGGGNLDDSLVGTTPYDWRYTNYDPRTGAESNGSPVMDEDDWLSLLRGSATVTPVASGDAAILQRFYRRGGTLGSNWYFAGENASDGAAFSDDETDISISTAGTLAIDNDQPVTTVDADGVEILGQPLPSIWGPVQDTIFGCGDPYRPGYVYWCRAGAPDAWPAQNNLEVCSPTEELMAGVAWGGQSYAFSRQRMYVLYPNLTAPGAVTSTPSACTHGLVARHALTAGYGGIFFLSDDGIYSTQGGPEASITDDKVRPLFNGEARYGLEPVDFDVPEKLQLAINENELWFFYQDTAGDQQILIFSLTHPYWRHYEFTPGILTGFSDGPETDYSMLLGGSAGETYTHEGVSDDGVAIAGNVRTGALDQEQPRQLKLYGDVILDVDRGSQTLMVTPYINTEASALAAYAISTGSGRQRYTNDPFGSGPQLARNISFDFSWSGTTTPPTIYLLGTSFIVQPDTTVGRYTDWDFGGRATDKYVKGLIIECDTFGADKTVDIEADGAVQTSITANSSGRQILQFSFTEFRGRLLRLHPTDANDWVLYGIQWIFDEEPLSLGRWETQELTFRIPGHGIPLYANIALRSTGAVTLAITGTRQDGTTFSLAPTPIASTGGAKQKPYVPLPAGKGVLFKLLFTASSAFWLYREESELVVMPWAGAEPIVIRSFGDDDLDQVRGLQSAEGIAAAGGGGQR